MKKKSQWLTNPTLIFLLLLIGLLLGACSNANQAEAIPAITPSQVMPIPDDLQNTRYCEILPVFRNGLSFTVEVYNTIGISDCPPERWQQIDTKSVRKTSGALLVRRNGPRYWVINEAIGSGETASGKIADIDGMEMKLVAKIELKLMDLFLAIANSSYRETVVARSNSWIYYAGNQVYELISPEGEVYRMQSYSQMVDPTLVIDDLEMLGERLDLPKGWSYHVRVLDNDSELKADGMAYMINDEFFNAYMKVTP